jgi:hypothetical protein
MRAVVVDIKGNKAVGLTPNGAFVKIKNTGKLVIGCEVDLPTGVIKFNGFVKAASIAAALILVLGLGLFAYNTPYSYIDIDINPSIEVTVNVFNRIIDIKALNTDGNKIVNNVSIKNREVKTGIANILKTALANGYLKDSNTSAVMFTVSGKSDNKVFNIEKTVQSTTSKELKAVNANPEVVVEKVTVENHDKAIKQGISPGKLLLIQRATEAKPELKTEELKEKPVNEILKLIREDKKDNEKESNTNKANPTPDKVKKQPVIKPTPKPDNAVNKNKDKDTNKVKNKDSDKDKDKDKNNKNDKSNNSKNVNTTKNNDIQDKKNDTKKSNNSSFNQKDNEDKKNYQSQKSTEKNNKSINNPFKNIHWNQYIPQYKSQWKKKD